MPKAKNKGGQPTKYKPEYCQGIIDYFNSEITDAKGKYNDFPIIAGYAAKIGVNRDTLFEWAKVHPKFSDSLKAVKAKQEQILVKGAMTNNYNPTFAIFFAKNNLGYKDKPEDIPPDQLEKENFITEIADVIKKYQ